LPEPEEDEYYFADLIGLRAEREDGEVIGTVAALNDFGAGELIEIERQGAMPVVLPFTKEAIPLVSLAEGRIVVAVNDEILADEALKSAENSAANRRTKKRRERKKRQK
jgi:16S rRNA processing protein RimM